MRSQVFMAHAVADQPECWPALPLNLWKDTYATLHMWTQIVGKVRLRLTPVVNLWWNIPLYVTARGLRTSRIPYGKKAFELSFDFIRHQLVLETSDGLLKALPLEPRSVAEFYQELMELLRAAGIEVKIWRMPVEISDPIPFDKDGVHASYDRASVEKFWRILLSVDTVLNEFRARFIGKSSPVHFFWGKFRSCGHAVLNEEPGLEFRAVINPAHADKFLEGSGHPIGELLALADLGQPLPKFPLGATFHARVSIAKLPGITPANIIGLLPGNDP
jgi:hypothetical protein